MGDAGERLVNVRTAVAAFGAALLALGCGGVTSVVDTGGGHAGKNGGGNSAGLDGTGGTDGTGGSAAGGASNISDGGEGECPGTQVRSGGRCMALGMVTPCARPPRSGFPGDSQCIDAPATELGMQLHFGPKDYSDPDEVAKFTLAPGSSDAPCMYKKAPDRFVHLKEWHARVRPGAFESILFEEGNSLVRTWISHSTEAPLNMQAPPWPSRRTPSCRSTSACRTRPTHPCSSRRG
jgi:hypothetical protein